VAAKKQSSLQAVAKAEIGGEMELGPALVWTADNQYSLFDF